MRIIEPHSGSIEVDGVDIKTYDIIKWRRLCAYINQDATLLYGTIRDNICFGTQGASQDEIIEACKIAGCLEFINKLPNGFETLVGEKGHSLSGGQRKRISIARALIRKPSVVILDEAFNSFERNIETNIIKNLKAQNSELTIILTSHMMRNEELIDVEINLNKN